jgi:DNA-binding CsgD family transcriptional regulator
MYMYAGRTDDWLRQMREFRTRMEDFRAAVHWWNEEMRTVRQQQRRRAALLRPVHEALGIPAPPVRAVQAVESDRLVQPAGKRPPGPLTRRQLEVAALIARGFSNRQVAETLVIAEGTAANHVEHILERLGFNNRAQIAAWVATQQASQNGLQAVDARLTRVKTA